MLQHGHVYLVEHYQLIYLQRQPLLLLLPLSLHKPFWILSLERRTTAPQASASECAFEVANRKAGDRIRHLLVELRQPFAWRKTVLRKDEGVIQIDRFVKAAARRVVVDDFDVLPDGPGLKRLPRNF